MAYVISFAMISPCYNELWFMLLYCVLTWALLAVAFSVADSLHRWKTAMACALVELVLAAVLSMLSSFAAAQLGTGFIMAGIFQLAGILASAMAVSRVFQMLSWPRTWLAGALTVAAYLLVGQLMAWFLLWLDFGRGI